MKPSSPDTVSILEVICEIRDLDIKHVSVKTLRFQFRIFERVGDGSSSVCRTTHPRGDAATIMLIWNLIINKWFKMNGYHIIN